jgi:hypothetical protein
MCIGAEELEGDYGADRHDRTRILWPQMKRLLSLCKHVESFFSNRQNIELTVSVAVLGVSAYAILFSIYAFRKQFELDMRPFVGITKVEPVVQNVAGKSSAAGLRIEATIKNFGKLPAENVRLRESWKLSKPARSRLFFARNMRVER